METLKPLNNSYIYLSSAMAELQQAIEIVTKDKEPLKHVIEIGHYQGISTAILTHFADRVFTFDTCHRNQEYVWELLGVRDKINMFVSTPEFIDYEINHYFNVEWKNKKIKTYFNFAFVDGDHTYEGIKHDFELVKFTGRVLFHDYAISPYPYTFCKEIGAKQVGDLNFAYWENIENTEGE
jgi:hypothetical protein